MVQGRMKAMRMRPAAVRATIVEPFGKLRAGSFGKLILEHGLHAHRRRGIELLFHLGKKCVYVAHAACLRECRLIVVTPGAQFH
jgi:hypothetical protein